ncbi:MAG: flagellar hook-length control protein FliK [Pseudomonadota bacterium]|nr:flagellar hook-length control protein FliK [Pseudomonadota bacterium]
MTLSAIDNPFGLIGADSMDADKGAKNSAFSTNSNLFSQLLSTTGVKQVAYMGSNDEFDETLNMQDQTVAHEARMGEDNLKYEGLGLMQGDAAMIESTRTPRELKNQFKGSTDGHEEELLYQQNAKGNRNNKGHSGEVTVVDPAESLALGPQNLVNGVDETRSANAAEARRASDTQLMRQTPQDAGTATAQLRAKPNETVTLEELPRSRYATSQPQSSNVSSTANHQKAGVQVTKVQEDMMSQPTSSLAAGVALAAQTDKPAKPSAEIVTTPAEDLDGEVRPSLANHGNIGRQERSQPTQPQAGQTQNPPAGPPPQPQMAPPLLPAQAIQQTQMTAVTTPRADMGLQTGQTIADPIAGGPGANNNGQSSQRSQQSQAPRPARPPVPPQEVTSQVAVQIKKAVGQGSDHIRIQLKPAELGRVEVKLEVTEDGRAMAVVSAERSDTLDLLQRDAAGLRQALQDAGLNTDSNSLSFNLRGEGSKFEQEMADRGQAPRDNKEKASDTGDGDELSAEESALLAAEAAASDGRINVQV